MTTPRPDDGDMGERVLTDDELEDLSRSPDEQLPRLLGTAPPEAVGAWAASVARAWQASVTGYHDWIAETQAYLFEHHGSGALSRLVPVTARFLAVHPDGRVADAGEDASAAPGADAAAPSASTGAAALAGTADPVPDALAADAAAEDLDAAIARFGRWQSERRRLHDLYRDWLSALLSHLYLEHGPDDLEAALRYTGERTLLRWMPDDIARPPKKRVVSWARMLHGHFTRFALQEDASKFIFVQDPCGSCTRQILQGRYEPPLSLAVVEEPRLMTWGRGHTPVYRAHIPVMHQSLPGGSLGVPWPVNLCPAGMGTGPCRILLYKDPLDPAAWEWFEAGLAGGRAPG